MQNLFCEGAFPCKIYFAKALSVQNLFCEGAFPCKIYFAKVPFRAKFILRRRSVLYSIGKRYNIFQKAKAQTKMGLRKINFALQLQNKFCTPIVK
ncbi:MAG: hypothetical protein DRR00_27765 [Candidatus Parabeggiatoa sp. nov. 3]|nr:MAG: hypothetical protein DRR00_27765 [Gammaproteobacteria bacterium]RKZ63392.1 MAG: hypothetical protein DRQ99_17195 [Gammaproteobacteria bacterium]